MVNLEQANFNGKRVIVRVDFNVPLDENFNITDDTRIRAAMPTINKVINDGGMIILMSHLGRPKKNPDPKYSLKHIVNYLGQVIGKEVAFADDCMNAEEKIAAMQNGDVLLLENLRFYAEEEGKVRGIEKAKKATTKLRKLSKKAKKNSPRPWLLMPTITSTTLSAQHTALTLQQRSSPTTSTLNIRCTASSWAKKSTLSIKS